MATSGGIGSVGCGARRTPLLPEKGGLVNGVEGLGLREGILVIEVSRGTTSDMDDCCVVGRTLAVVLVWRVRVRARG